MSAQEIAQAFSDHYYNMRNTNPGQVGSLFSANSKMTFEGELFQGTEAIVGKLTAIGRAQHTIRTLDVQPSISDSSILIFTSGVVQIEGSGNPLHFCECFQLVATGNNQYYIHNDIFRLNYGL